MRARAGLVALFLGVCLAPAVPAGAGGRAAARSAGPGLTAQQIAGGGNPSFGCECSLSIGLLDEADWPVNRATGEFFQTFSDIVIPGRGENLDFARTYSSVNAARTGPFGYGWSFSYGMSLEVDPSTRNVTVHQENGSTVTFVPDGSGRYAPPQYVLASLAKSKSGGGSYVLRRDRDGSTLTFDLAGKLTSVQDRNGYRTTLGYSSGRLTTVTDEAGRKLTLTYWTSGAGTGKVKSVGDQVFRSASFTYDAAGNLASATDVQGRVWSFTYDAAHRMKTIKTPIGQVVTGGGVVTNVYDAAGRVTSQTDPENRTTTYSYGSSSTTVTDPLGVETDDVYDGLLLTSRTEAVGMPEEATTTYTHDPATLALESTTDPNGHTWSYTHDDRGNVLTATDPLGHASSYTYDAHNLLLTSTDPTGVTTTNLYDARGNLTRTSTPVGGGAVARIALDYDPLRPGDLVAATDPEGNVWRYSYNANGDLVSEQDPLGNKTTYSYDAVGRIKSTVSPAGNVPGATVHLHTTTYEVNRYGDVFRVHNPEGATTEYFYDDHRNPAAITGPGDTARRFEWNLANELVGIFEDASGPFATRFAYDGAGNLVKRTNPAGRATTYEYDALGRRVEKTDPLGRVTSFAYDDGGRLVSTTDHAGRVTAYTYDDADRLTRISYDDGVTPDVELGYDPAGRRITMDDGPGSSSYEYDDLGRLTEATHSAHGTTNTVGYGYDLNGNVNSIRYPGGDTVAREHDDAGRMVSVTDWNGNETSFLYDVEGNVVRQTYPNGVVGRFDYNLIGGVTRISHRRDTDELLEITYDRHPSGLVFREGSDVFGQDRFNYLVFETSTFGQIDYRYDVAGQLDRITRTPGPTTTLAYDLAGQMTSTVTDGATTSFSFDPQGNRLASAPPAGPSSSYAYDQANRLTSYERGSTSASYTYDGDGLRSSKTVGAGPRRLFVWNLAEDLPTILSDGGTRYVTGPYGLPVERVSPSGEVRYFHQDQLGTTRLLTDAAGNPQATFRYDPYGNPRSKSKGADAEPIGFAGEYRDAESGLIYLRARYYDPVTHQFLSRDPLVDGTGEPYQYASNNPVNKTDPTGHSSVTVCFYRCAGAEPVRLGVVVPAMPVTHDIGPTIAGGDPAVVTMSLNKEGQSPTGCYWGCGVVDAALDECPVGRRERPRPPAEVYREPDGRPAYAAGFVAGPPPNPATRLLAQLLPPQP